MSVAAQACLPVLGLDLSWLSAWVTVLIVPREYETEFADVDEAGVVHEGIDVASGQYLPLGSVVLSLADVLESGHGLGYNVVIHETAHVLDARSGSLNGAPPLHDRMDARSFTRELGAAYADLQRKQAAPGRRAARRRSALDPSAAEAPEEFFAVSSELFFERPLRLRLEYPEVYGQLALFYRQDPAARV